MDHAPAGLADTVALPRPWIALGPREAPAIVFLHGTRLTRGQWSPQLRRLSTRYRCVAVDLPGHGLRGGDPFTLEAAVGAVAEAIDAEVPAGRAVLVGLSLGGYVAIETAEARPDLVVGLVLAGCSAEAIGPRAWPFQVLAALMEGLPPRLVDRLNRSFFTLRYPRSIAGPIIDGGFWPAGGAEAVRALLGRPYLERLGRLWTPVLVVNGALDPVFAPQGEHWAASCRAGRHVTIRRAMHLSSLDRPRAFSEAVASFVDQTSRDA
jgi:pimeloyl-ACP methyl ester carboxylesterase